MIASTLPDSPSMRLHGMGALLASMPVSSPSIEMGLCPPFLAAREMFYFHSHEHKTATLDLYLHTGTKLPTYRRNDLVTSSFALQKDCDDDMTSPYRKTGGRT